MTEVKVTFKMEASDPAHSSGLTEEDYEQLSQVTMELGGYDLEIEKV